MFEGKLMHWDSLRAHLISKCQYEFLKSPKCVTILVIILEIHSKNIETNAVCNEKSYKSTNSTFYFLAGIESLAHGCRKIKSFIAKGVIQITDRAISSLAQSCPDLETLILHGCAVSKCRKNEFHSWLSQDREYMTYWFRFFPEFRGQSRH